MKNSDTQQRFFEFLKQREAASKTFTVEEASAQTGLSEASVRTYLSKKLKDRWVFATDGSHYEVKGFSPVPIREFARVMSQKTQARFTNLLELHDQVEELCRQGKAQGFDVKTLLRVLAEKF